MAITSDLIGRIGGGGTEIHQIPVNFVSSSGNGMKHVADVPVPAGKQARIIVLSYTSPLPTAGMISSGIPHLHIGGEYAIDFSGFCFGATSIVTGPVAVEVKRRNAGSSYDPSFVGDIFWWEVDD